MLPYKPKVSFKFRDIKNLNLAQFYNKFQEYDWSDFYNSDSPTMAWEKLYRIYLTIADELVPAKEVYDAKGKEDWVNKDVLKDLKHRDELRGKLNYSNCKLLKADFLRAKNKARRAANKARQQFISDKIDRVRLNPRKFWQELKSLMPGKKSIGKTNDYIHLKNEDDELIEELSQAAKHANVI